MQTILNTNHTNLTHHFLIAMPQLHASHFAQTITYVIEHSSEGTLGLVINNQSEVTLKDLLEHLNLNDSDTDTTAINLCAHKTDLIYNGGPVQTDRGFILHRDGSQWESTLTIANEINLTSSKDILAAIQNNQGPDEFLIALGYAGWSAGQLEQEVAQNAWLTVKANPDIIFKTPVEQRWQQAALALGILDMNLMSLPAGHA